MQGKTLLCSVGCLWMLCVLHVACEFVYSCSPSGTPVKFLRCKLQHQRRARPWSSSWQQQRASWLKCSSRRWRTRQQVQQLTAERDSLHHELQQSQQLQRAAQLEADELAQQLQLLEGEMQQLQQQPGSVTQAAAALHATAQLQQPLQQPDHATASAEAGDAQAAVLSWADSGADDGDGDCELHALRAELGVAHAEIARLQHELAVVSCSRAEERELTGQEIMRLQQELTEAVSSSSLTNSRGALQDAGWSGTTAPLG